MASEGNRKQVDRVLALARQLLAIEVDEGRHDLWLWEHADRVRQHAVSIARLPGVPAGSADLTAVEVAAVFHDAGWMVEHQQGRWDRWQLLSRPTNEIQRELAAAMLQEEISHLLPGTTVRRAADAIRACNNRNTDLIEARILAEAEALDEVGAVHVLRQFRLYQGDGRPITQLVDTWNRQKEYHYWEMRLADGFRYDATRELARQRLEQVDVFLQALQGNCVAADVRRLLPADPDAPAEESA